MVSEFIESPERRDSCLNIHQLQGMIAATNSCPDYVTETDFVFEVMGECDDGLEQWFEEGELRRAFVTCLNEIDEALALDKFSLAAIYPIDDTQQAPSSEFSDWCDGYLRGYMLTETAWEEVHEFLESEGITDIKEEHQALLSVLASFAMWNETLVDDSDPEKLKQGFPMMFQIVDDGVTRFHKLGLTMEENRLRSEEKHLPYVREDVKAGRNDPCPCGSGRKYKKCCLH